MQNHWSPQSLDVIMDTEDLPANNAPLTVNEQVFLSQVIMLMSLSNLTWNVTKTQMYLNISSHVQPHAPCVWVFSLRSQHKQFSSVGEEFAESIAYASFWANALVCLLYSCHLCPCWVGCLCPNVCLASLFSLAIHSLTAEVFSQLLGSCTLKFPAQDDQVRTLSCLCTAELSWASLSAQALHLLLWCFSDLDWNMIEKHC